MEENKIILNTPNIDIKTIKIKDGENEYKCQIQIIKNYIQVNLYLEDKLKHEGNILLSKIQNQIYTFIDYNINEIYEEINILNNNNFKLIKELNKYKLKIEFNILKRKKYLIINLDENENIEKNDLIKNISELKEIIKKDKEIIKSLQDELKQYKNISINNNNNYNNFNIKLKEPIHILKYHTSGICCATILNDGRFATGSGDNSIIIFNNKSFQPDITIKEHNNWVCGLTQLSSGNLVSCSGDKTIKLYNINNNQYTVLQTLNNHTNYVYKVIELNNKKLVSCSYDKSIIFYIKENNEYKMDYKISTNGYCYNVIQTKENEISYTENKDTICFFDLPERKYITKINNISICSLNSMKMISKDLLVAGGENIINIINVNNHNIIRKINVPGSSWIHTVLLLNENILLTGDYNKQIIQWEINGDNLILNSKKEHSHENYICAIIKIGDGLIISGDYNGIIKVW